MAGGVNLQDLILGGHLNVSGDFVVAPPVVLALAVALHGHVGGVGHIPFEFSIELALGTVKVHIDLVLLHVVTLPADGGGQGLAIGQGGGLADTVVSLAEVSLEQLLAVQLNLSHSIGQLVNVERAKHVSVRLDVEVLSRVVVSLELDGLAAGGQQLGQNSGGNHLEAVGGGKSVDVSGHNLFTVLGKLEVKVNLVGLVLVDVHSCLQGSLLEAAESLVAEHGVHNGSFIKDFKLGVDIHLIAVRVFRVKADVVLPVVVVTSGGGNLHLKSIVGLQKSSSLNLEIQTTVGQVLQLDLSSVLGASAGKSNLSVSKNTLVNSLVLKGSAGQVLLSLDGDLEEGVVVEYNSQLGIGQVLLTAENNAVGSNAAKVQIDIKFNFITFIISIKLNLEKNSISIKLKELLSSYL